MTRALVTGASGFIGGHLAEALLRQGDSVRCLVRPRSSRTWLQHADLELVDGDVLDPESLSRAVAGVDVVYHVGGLTAHVQAARLNLVNGQGTDNLAAACAAQTSPPVLVYVSSIAAAGPVARHQVRREADADAPVSDYGRSKKLGERAVQRWAARVPATIVRPGIVFGPRNRDMLPIFQTMQRFRLHFSPGMVAPPLSYISVKDLVALIIQAARVGRRLPADSSAVAASGTAAAAAAVGRYFATCDEFPTYAEFGKLVARALDIRSALVIPVAFPLPWIFAGLSQLLLGMVGKQSQFNLDKIREATEESWACSSAAAVQDLNYQITTPLVDQLRATAAWYRQHGWL